LLNNTKAEVAQNLDVRFQMSNSNLEEIFL